jgi:uncharacterized FAD-dependent dehydrogenase
MKAYDIGIIGAGVAGSFAALRLAEKHRNLKVVMFEFGPPPPNCLRRDPIRIKRRRRQLEGWFGCWPTGDGKVYPGDVEKVLDVADGRRVKNISKWFFGKLNEVNPVPATKPRQPSTALQRKISELGLDLSVHSYHQWTPDPIHHLSRITFERIENAKNVEFSFDNEVYGFLKRGGRFLVSTSCGEYSCKRLLLCAGRSGWRWIKELYNSLGILVSNDTGRYGVRVELPAQYLKDFNKSHCSLKKDDLRIGPLSWGGSVIQEDHADVTIAAFRSNEDRWKTDKVFFSLTKEFEFPNEACKQLERIASLAFLLSNDRVGRERIKSFVKGDSQLSLLPEYVWLPDILKQIEPVFPNLIGRGYLHVPEIDTITSVIRIGSNLETDVNGLFVAGESAGIKGIAAAGISGATAAEGASK